MQWETNRFRCTTQEKALVQASSRQKKEIGPYQAGEVVQILS